MTFIEATCDYEAWLAAAIPEPLVRADLDLKHRLLADPADPFPFFRGTYYRWARHWASAGPAADAPRVLAVGDLHVANFGTWRDADCRLCWGVNDFDEADDLPYTNDLVRLAASVRVAKKAGALDVKLGDACDAILDGYRGCLAAGGRPFVLEEHHPHLRALATAADRDPATFWGKMAKLLDDPPSDPPADARAALEASLPATGLKAEYRARPGAGVGSLGRPRYVALVEWAGGRVCREAKAAAPPATAWARGASAPCRAGEAAGRAVRAPDPIYRLAGRWVVRRLGPRSSRVELGPLRSSDLGRVLRAMGAETANVHLGTPGVGDAIQADLGRRAGGWLAEAARSMADLMAADWAAWRSAGPLPPGGPHQPARQ